eukprot:TRINITY_DN46520_c0_g1_i1.p1 TRINITY_DN46520_c0_g1~~TRINITY_DN46520_c0_g1_i1.p1  ORF type:complete len:132 (+),score=14.38 TRINITY_DN46520_c0_g1_i1:298-693(+)
MKVRRDDLGPDTVGEGEHVPIVLIGNQVDLVRQQERQVDYAEAHERATSWRCGFFETSAKTRLNVEEAFSELIRYVKRMQQRRAEASRPKALPAPSPSRTDPTEDLSQSRSHEQFDGAQKKVKKKRKCVIL